MATITIDLNWEDPQGARGAELRATWAQVKIMVGDTPVTRVYDGNAGGVRDHVYLPLYPLAEWVASHWWSLLNEQWNPRRREAGVRHNLRHGREGFSFPNFLAFPTDDSRLELTWSPCQVPGQRVVFLNRGHELVSRLHFEGCLKAFVETVINRLVDSGIQGSPLQQEWEAIRSAEEVEASENKLLAAAGLDPYDTDEILRGKLVSAASVLPEELRWDFSGLVHPNEAGFQSQTLIEEIELLDQSRAAEMKLPCINGRIDSEPESSRPWEQGYRAARQLRRLLAIDAPPLTLSNLLDAVGLDPSGLVFSPRQTPSLFDAIAKMHGGNRASFLIHKNREDSRRFAFCRLLGEFLLSDSTYATASILRSTRQMRGRAFAAEFLVPSDILRGQVTGDYVDDDALEELARTFAVSSVLVRHQLENHAIARVLDETGASAAV